MIEKYLMEHFGLQEQVAVITGGSGMLGRLLALALASAGAKVAVLGQRAEAIASVVEEIQTSGRQALGFPCDVTNRTALMETSQAIMERLGRHGSWHDWMHSACLFKTKKSREKEAT